jgi:DNA-directed RNA polymerase specialized sigma24 family protein
MGGARGGAGVAGGGLGWDEPFGGGALPAAVRRPLPASLPGLPAEEVGVERLERAELSRLMARLADGDRAAFGPAFALLWPLLRSFAERCLGTADAEDAAQSALLAVFARASEFDSGRDAAAWALGIAAWECKTLRRKRMRRREEQGAPPEAVSAQASPEEALAERDLHEAISSIIGTLRPIDVETLTTLANGTAGGATFRKRVSRALGRFRLAWRARHGND